MANSLGQDIHGRVVVIREGLFKAQYKAVQHRLFRAEGGFGCSPDTIGSAVVGYHLNDGERCRWEGHNIERLATEDDLLTIPGCTEALHIPTEG